MGGIISSGSELKNAKKITYKIHIAYSINDEEGRVGASKKERKQQKQLLKIKETLNRCYRSILKQDFQICLPSLKQVVMSENHLDISDFRGAGNQQAWHGFHKQGVISWMKQQGQAFINPFDLLSISFYYLIKHAKLTLEECSQWYEEALCNEDRFQLYFGLANLYYNNKRYVKAEQYYRKSMALNSNFARTYQYIAWIYGYWFDFDSASSQYATKSLEMDPSSITCRYILALTQQQPMVRKTMLQQIIEKYPNYYRIYVNLGELQNDSEKSKYYYNKCIQIDPQYKFVYLKLGDMERFAQNFQQAKSFYMKVKQIDEDQDYTYFYLGCLAEDEGNYEEAIILYFLCYEMNPYNADICATISNYYRNMGEMDKAINYMHKQLEQNPYDYQNCNLLGIFYDDEGEPEKAIEYFTKSKNIYSQYYEPYVNLGSSYQEKKQYEVAKGFYLKAIELKPHEADSYFGMAVCQGSTKNVERAIEWCQKCIKRGCDEDKLVYEYMGDLYKQENQFQQSFHSYLTFSIESHTLHTQYILNNLMCLFDRTEAIRIIKKELEVQKQGQFFYAEIGKILLAFSQTRLSVYCFQKLIQLSKDHYLSTAIEEQIKRYNGTSEYIQNNYPLGVRGYQDQIRFLILKNEFEQKYKFLYQQ